MSRKSLRAELQASWSVFEPRIPGTPIRKKDLHDAKIRDILDALHESDHCAITFTARDWLEYGADLARIAPSIVFDMDRGVLRIGGA